MKEIDPYLIQPKMDINQDLSGKYKMEWTESTLELGSSEPYSPEAMSGISHIGTSFTKTKFWIFFASIVFTVTIIFFRLWYLQVYQGQENHTRAEMNRQRIVPIPSERGLFFDKNNIQLTQNIPNFSLAIVPQDLPKKQSEFNNIIQELSHIIEKDSLEISDILNQYRDYQRDSIIIEEDIPYETALKIKIAASDLPGIIVQQSSKRLYIHQGLTTTTVAVTTSDTLDTNESSLSHVLGYVGKLSPEELEIYYERGYLPSDSIGKIGVEKTYEETLRGTYGKKRIEVDARGREQSVLAEESPISGDHLILSIDVLMQNELERSIKTHLEKSDKKRASGIVLDPNTGEILALISYPGYDNNDFSGGIDTEKYSQYISDENEPLFNRAIAGTYPSGSVIKPAMAAAALAEGIITQNTTFNSVGGLRVGSWFFPDWKPGGHGITDVKKSIAWSVNTFYYMIGGGFGDFVGLGVDKIEIYLRLFGFASKLGIDIPSEAEGFVPSQAWKEEYKGERWYVGDTYNLSIGQGDLLVTPLQIASMTATIANRGTLYQPHIVKAIQSHENKEKITYIEPKIIKKSIIEPAYLSTVRLGMHDCVVYGSCWELRNLPFASAGKTGTAQWNNNKDTHAWFTSFAPFDNPEIVVTIMVEEGGEGSLAAEPIAADFFKWWAKYRTN